MGRLVPQLQILFVAQPLQIMGGLLLFAIVMTAGMGWFLDTFVQQFNVILPS
jgi:flagellar biosynthetic protein FliR